MRITPNNTPAPETTPVPAPSDLAVIAAAVGTAPADEYPTIVGRIVREWTSARRDAVTLAAMDAGSATLAMAVRTAPVGPDPVGIVSEWIADELARVGAVILAAADEWPDAFGADPAPLASLAMAAAMTRATPATTDELAAITTPAPTRRRGDGSRERRNVVHAWPATVSGEYVGPTRGGSGTSAVRITIRNGSPTFHVVGPDGSPATIARANGATRALAIAGGWYVGHDADGAHGRMVAPWPDPFTTLRRVGGARDGATLGELTAPTA